MIQKWHNCDRKTWHNITGNGGTIASGVSSKTLNANLSVPTSELKDLTEGDLDLTSIDEKVNIEVGGSVGVGNLQGIVTGIVTEGSVTIFSFNNIVDFKPTILLGDQTSKVAPSDNTNVARYVNKKME